MMPIQTLKLEVFHQGGFRNNRKWKANVSSSNTVIFAEDGLDMVEGFEVPEEIKAGRGGGFVPLDRYINDIKKIKLVRKNYYNF